MQKLSSCLLSAAALALAGCQCQHRGATSGQLVSAAGIPAADGLDFGQVPVGQRKLLTLTVRNDGSGPLAISSAAIGGANAGDFALLGSLVAEVQAGQSVSAQVQFSPQDGGARNAFVTLGTDSSTAPSYQVSLTGVGFQILIAAIPPTLDFGKVQVGTRKTLPVQFSNLGKSPATVQLLSPLGAQAADFSSSGQGGALQPGQTVTVQVTFEPALVGPASATLPYAFCQGCVPIDVQLTGVGIDGQLTLSPSPVAFGSVPKGQSATRTLTAQNPGSAPIALVGLATQSGASNVFSLSGLPPSFPGTPLSLAPGQSTTFVVAYSPQNPAGDADALVATYRVVGVPDRQVQDALSGNELLTPCSLAIQPPALDFGTDNLGQALTLQVTLRNSGQTACAVSAVALGTGTDPAFALDPNAPTSLSVAPGGSSAISVTFDPQSTNTPLQHTGTLTFQTSDAAHPAVNVPLTGALSTSSLVPCTLAVKPTALDFGNVAANQPATLSVTLTNGGEIACQLSAIAIGTGSDPSFALASPGQTQLTVAVGGSATIGVTFDVATQALPLTRGGTLVFQATDPANSSWSVPLTGNLIPTPCALTIQPATVDFGTVAAGQSASQQVSLVNSGETACQVSGIGLGSGTDPGFSLGVGQATSLTVAPGGSSSIGLSFTDSQDVAPFTRQGTLVFQTTDPAHANASIPLTVALPQSPCSLSVSPSTLSFGTVAQGKSITLQATLADSGQTACQISAIGLTPTSDPDFALVAGQAASLTVPAGGSATIGVTFTDVSDQSPFTRLGVLTFATSDAASPSMTVALSGQLPQSSCGLSIQPASLSFGTVGPNQPVTLQVTVTDNGQTACSVSQIVLGSGTDPDFSLAAGQSTSFAVAPGQSATIGVTFDAPVDAAPLSRTGTLVFQTGDPVYPSASVPLAASLET
ncbi:MAG: choice-of-anchor D domain-containing protein, partial [Deltaproteobacteria bacterium]